MVSIQSCAHFISVGRISCRLRPKGHILDNTLDRPNYGLKFVFWPPYYSVYIDFQPDLGRKTGTPGTFIDNRRFRGKRHQSCSQICYQRPPVPCIPAILQLLDVCSEFSALAQNLSTLLALLCRLVCCLVWYHSGLCVGCVNIIVHVELNGLFSLMILRCMVRLDTGIFKKVFLRSIRALWRK